MDLQDQLKNLFPGHKPAKEEVSKPKEVGYYIQEAPIICKYEKRKGKPITLLEGYTGATADFKKLTRELQSLLGVGGSFKKDIILIQGDYRSEIMKHLIAVGFKVKRVGG